MMDAPRDPSPAHIPAPGIAAVAWEMIAHVRDEGAKLAMLRAEMEAERRAFRALNAELAANVERARETADRLEAAERAAIDRRRRECGITASDLAE